jgi:alginate O-acetyltransferase complex protein AlgJ
LFNINRPGVTRRTVLGGAAGGVFATVTSRRARAAVVDLVAVGKDGWLFPIWDEVRRVEIKRLPQVVDRLGQAMDLMKGAKIQVAIVLTPVKSRIYKEFLPDDFKFTTEPDHRYAMALEQLRHTGALVPDLAAPLLAMRTAEPNKPLFFRADTHWTALGAEAAATEVARQIQDKFHLPASAQPGTKLGPLVTALQSKNDLAALLPPAQAAQYPLESFQIHQVEDGQESGALVDDDAADVVLIGNSFMQPKLGFQPMLSNQLNRPVSLVWKVHQVGPYQTLLSYLHSEAFRRQRPNLIVWNFHETDITTPSDRRDGWGQNAMAPQAFLDALRQAISG